MTKNKKTLPIIIEKDKHGFFAYCPVLQGCYTEGSSYELAIKNIKDAIRLHLIDRKNQNFVLPEFLSLSSVEVIA